ncbi:MAG: sigma-70 family RNA polymerase sigma factor [Deltaproteobacteria bacterium]|nr:sigma-70 family RNA polymerase sigma factor [Deltaproteobacteria bacterium]
MALDEATLIKRLRERDERAFRQLVDEHQNRVFGLLVRMIGNASEAEDLMQEVFIQVFKAIDQFRGDAKLSTWLYRIAANTCKNRMKYLNRRSYSKTDALDPTTEGAEVEAGGQPLAARVPTPDRMLEGQQLDAIVQEAIATLDEDHKLLVVLRDMQDLSYEEICEVTGLNEGTVKSRLHRARMALKEKLAKRGV